jgi:hypothetical protein
VDVFQGLVSEKTLEISKDTEYECNITLEEMEATCTFKR